MESIMAMGLGDKLNLIGLACAVTGGLVAIVGTILMYVGAGMTGESVFQSLRKTQLIAEQSTVKQREHWMPDHRVELDKFIPPTATHISIAYRMHSADTRVPLMMRISTRDGGEGLLAYASGEMGNVELMLEGSEAFVSVSHPSIEWTISASGWTDSI